VRHRLQQVAAGAVHLSERDERAAEVVPAAVAEAEQLEVAPEGVLRFWAQALRHVPRGHDEVVLRGRAPVSPLPSAVAPIAQHRGKRGMDRDAPWDLRLRPFEVQRSERLQVAIVLPPAQGRCLAVAKCRQRLESAEHAAIFEHAHVRDQVLDLFTREDRLRPE
jgi:hypothetical protein